MSYRKPITGRVENYTVPFLWMAGVILFMVLCTVAVLHGYLGVALFAVALDAVIQRLGRRRRHHR